MITPINRVHSSEDQQISKPDVAKPQPQPVEKTPESGELSRDQVTLKNAVQVDAEGAD